MVGIPMFHTEEAWSRDSIYARLLRCCDAILANTAYEKQFVEERVTERTRVLVASTRDTGKMLGGIGIGGRPGTQEKRKDISYFPSNFFRGRSIRGPCT